MRAMDRRRLHLLIERLANVMREDLRAVATGHDLALAQLEALHYLGAANRFSDTLSALVLYLGATKGTVSQTLAALVRKGLVEQVRDADDARIWHCRLTPAGEAIARASLPAPCLRDSDEAGAEAALEGLIRRMLAARGGVAFGVCRTCVHHEARRGGARCRLLDVPLSAEDAGRLCKEHAPRPSPPPNG